MSTTQFQIGDARDKALCIDLTHEFLRCDDAFNDFAASAKTMIATGDNRRLAYKTYNAYSRFILHLYEFMLGAIARDRKDLALLKGTEADKYIASHAQRNLTNRRDDIINGRAPSWENNINYYPEKLPTSFAKEFRDARNAVSVHILAKRSTLNMSDFYNRNHKYLGLLYRDAQSWWGRRGDDFPDLAEITAFSVLVKEGP